MLNFSQTPPPFIFFMEFLNSHVSLSLYFLGNLFINIRKGGTGGDNKNRRDMYLLLLRGGHHPIEGVKSHDNKIN